MKADKDKVLRRLKTARGQVEGLIKMVEDDRYCIDISNQIMAVQAVLRAVNGEVLKAHLENCVRDAARNGVDKIDEVTDIIKKLLKG
ncbi:MAG: metal-sensing transcriptional repressor [Clostridia bacterium]